MGTNENNKVHEEAEKLAHKQQNLAVMSDMSGEDASAKYGVIASGTAQTIVAENEALTTEQKKQKEFYRNLILQGLIKDLDKMFDDIDGMIDDYKASVDRSNRLGKALKDGNFDEMRLILSSEYGENTDHLSNEEVQAKAEEKFKEEIETQTDLEQAILKRIEEAQRKIDKLDPESPDSADLKKQYQDELDKSLAEFKEIAAKKPDLLNYNNAEKSVLKQVGSDNELFSSNRTEVKIQEQKQIVQEARSTSYSASVDEIDPFAEVAGITDPFNVVASDMGYDSNDLNATQPKPDTEIKTDLNVINKPVVLGMN